MQILLKKHKHIANAEYNHYINLRNSVLRGQEPDKVHLVIDFVEKVLLSPRKSGPGSLHFVRGLNFDFWGFKQQ